MPLTAALASAVKDAQWEFNKKNKLINFKSQHLVWGRSSSDDIMMNYNASTN